MSEIEEPPDPPRRRHGRVRRWVVRPFFWGLLLLFALIAGTWFFFQTHLARERVLARIVTQAERFLGRDIQIGDVDYAFFPPALELRDIVIPGTRPGDPPVLRAPFARVQIAVRDLRGRVFDLEQIEIVRPQVYLQFNPDGTDNLPDFRFGQRRGPKRFDVRVGRILIENGTLTVNERRLPLTVDAKAIWGRLTGRAERGGEGGNRLDALITAQEVVPTPPRAKPYPFTLSAKGSILPDQGRVSIANARFAGPDLSGDVEGFVAYRGPERRIELGIEAEGAARLANRLGYLKDPIEGPARVTARVRWTKEDWSYGGRATSPRLAVLDRVFEDIEASFNGRKEALDVNVEHAHYAGGTLEGLIAVDTEEDVPGTPISLDLDFAGLSLQKVIGDQFPGEELPIVSGLSGRAGGNLQYRFNTEAAIAGSGRADVQVQATSEGGLPIAGDLPILLNNGVVSSRDLRLTAPGQVVTSNGFTYDLQRGAGSLDFRLVSQDVGPLYPLLAGRQAPGEEPPFWLPTRGRGVAEGTATFARRDLALRIALDLQDVVAPVTTADRVNGSFVFTPRAVDELRLEMVRGGGVLRVAGRIPLPEEGRETASQPMTLAVDATQWPASGLAYFLGPELTRQVQGELTGRVDLSGTTNRLTGRVDAQARDLVVAGTALGRAEARASFDQGRITVEEGRLDMPAGTVYAQGSYDQNTEAMSFTVLGPSLSLDDEPFRRYLNGELTGRMSIEAAASGTLSQPQATVSVAGRNLVLRGRPVGADRETSAVAVWDGQRVDVRGSLLGLASFQGGGRLDRQGTDLSIELRTDQLGTLAGVLAPRPLPDFSGSLLGTLTAEADFQGEDYRAALWLSDLRLRYQERTIANREPVVLALTPERVTIESFYLGEPDTENELVLSGSVSLAENVPLDLRFQSTIAASWAEIFLPQEYRIEGALDLLGSVRGTLEAPSLLGQGEIRGASAIVPGLAQEIEDVRGFLSFNRDRIVIEEMQARFGNGTVRVADGALVLPGPGRELSYRLVLNAQGVSIRFPAFLLNRGNAEITLASTADWLEIVGDVRLDRSLYVEDVPIDLLAFIRNLFQRQRQELAETDDFEATTQLNLSIRGPDALRVRNNVADLQGDISLTVRGTLARPVLFGEVEVDEGGTLVFSENEYEVQRGLLTFGSTSQIDPVIDLVATTEIQQFNITLTIGGTLNQPDINFASDSNLADLEILGLIATGERPDLNPVSAQPTNQDAAASRAAQDFLVGQAASAISKRVGQLFPFDRFQVFVPENQGTGQASTGLGVTVGRRLSRDVFVTYTYDPASNQQYIVQVEWQVRKNVTMVLTREGDDSFAIDAQWQRRF
ncbi:MAG TPA: translocation/assembly module TamB domain-containing protein [Thermoanaerobaculia bacterium]|nr:translocation/assembly module TamB domain-containing protein [Thermoanaerobaculia bacterium]